MAEQVKQALLPQNIEEAGVIQRIQSDIQWIKWIIGAGIGIILTILMYLHTESNNRLTRMGAHMAGMESRITTVEGSIIKMEGRMTTVEGSIIKMESRISKMEQDLSEIKSDIKLMLKKTKHCVKFICLSKKHSKFLSFKRM